MKLFKSITSALKDRENAKHLRITLDDNTITDDLFHLNFLEELIIVSKEDIKLDDRFAELKNISNLTIQTSKEFYTGQSIFHLPVLKHLKVRCSKIHLSVPPAPTHSLETLMLNDCGLESVPYSLFEITSLKTINLSGNKIKELPSSIKELQNLVRLIIDRNLLTKLPKEMELLPRLAHLSLDGNKFSAEEKERIQKIFNIWFN